MASYLPPKEELPIFDNSVFQSNDDPLTFAQASTEFLRFPSAQGAETLQDISVNGAAIFNALVDINDDLTVNGNLNVQLLTTTNNLSVTTLASIQSLTVNNTTTTLNLSVGAISTLTVATQAGATFSLNLGTSTFGRSWTWTLTNNVTSIVFTGGVIGGQYKIWMTGGASIFTINKGTIVNLPNTLLGVTNIGIGSIWLITVYKVTATLYRADFINFT
jgi:hypothetical protein